MGGELHALALQTGTPELRPDRAGCDYRIRQASLLRLGDQADSDRGAEPLGLAPALRYI